MKKAQSDSLAENLKEIDLVYEEGLLSELEYRLCRFKLLNSSRNRALFKVQGKYTRPPLPLWIRSWALINLLIVAHSLAQTIFALGLSTELVVSIAFKNILAIIGFAGVLAKKQWCRLVVSIVTLTNLLTIISFWSFYESLADFQQLPGGSLQLYLALWIIYSLLPLTSSSLKQSIGVEVPEEQSVFKADLKITEDDLNLLLESTHAKDWLIAAQHIQHTVKDLVWAVSVYEHILDYASGSTEAAVALSELKSIGSSNGPKRRRYR